MIPGKNVSLIMTSLLEMMISAGVWKLRLHVAQLLADQHCPKFTRGEQDPAAAAGEYCNPEHPEMDSQYFQLKYFSPLNIFYLLGTPRMR